MDIPQTIKTKVVLNPSITPKILEKKNISATCWLIEDFFLGTSQITVIA